jgi:hypothetical protein
MGNEVLPFLLYDLKARSLSFEEGFPQLFPVYL